MNGEAATRKFVHSFFFSKSHCLFQALGLCSQKFGLFAIDFKTTDLNRTAKASAKYYAQIVKDNGFTPDQPCNNQSI